MCHAPRVRSPRKHIDFVSFDHAGEVTVLGVARHNKKSMAPAEGSGAMNPHARRRLAHAQTFVHRRGLKQPFSQVAQPCHWGARQGIEGRPAVAALEPLQAIGLAIAH